MTQKIRVLPVGSALVPDYEAMDQGVLRFIGRRHDPSIGVNGGWVPTGNSVEIPLRPEYVQEMRAGALAPADKESAQLAGVKFDAGKVN